jgi:hypothetical protein
MSKRQLVDPTPELPDDTPVDRVRFPTRIQNVLVTAGLKTVGEVRETADETPLSFQDLGHSSIKHLRTTLGLPSGGAGSGHLANSQVDLLSPSFRVPDEENRHDPLNIKFEDGSVRFLW